MPCLRQAGGCWMLVGAYLVSFIMHSAFFILHTSFYILHSTFFILHFSFLNTPSMIPSTIPSNAATITLYSSGNRNVIVWAGTQKNGIVLNTVKSINCLQLILSIVAPIVIFLSVFFNSR
ncbi:MAG: hypothetical protein CVU00_04770 [Bacteroidetes bacterium HGW-Bacteroidetes-17]|nr:MAG: hypothetical protein CVU00_04770 [Bacteroidetes bacterium HGW-Bacteroidetes-17]